MGYSKVGFTWWGGFIGASLLSHVRCNGCGGTFSSKTGQSNTGKIAIYMAVVAVLAFGIGFALLGAGHRHY